MTRPDPSHYGTDGNRHALDVREYDEQDDEAPRRKLTPREARYMQEEGL